MRTTMLSLSLLAAPLMACGDDEPVTPDMGTPIDMPRPIDAPDAFVDPGVDFDSDEGGELRLEYLKFTDGGNGIRATAFFYKNPGAVGYHQYVDLNGCTNTAPASAGRDRWPFKTETDRTYANAGSVIVSNPGDGTFFSIPKNTTGTPGQDLFARVHGTNNWYFKSPGTNAAPANDGNLMPPKARLSVQLTGSADMPAQSFDDVLFVPADFTINDSTGTLDPAPYAGTPIPAATALNVTFENSTDDEPAGYRVDSLVAFTGANGPAVVCIEPKDGSVTVPAAMVDVARGAYASGGTFARQTLTHVVRELTLTTGGTDAETNRRIDFVTVWCYATGFSVP